MQKVGADKKLSKTNKIYYWFIIVVISSFSIWSIYGMATLKWNMEYNYPDLAFFFFSLIIQSILLILILKRHKYAYSAIKSWSFIFLICFSLAFIIGQIFVILADNFIESDLMVFLMCGFILTIGIFVFIAANRLLRSSQ